MAKKIGMFKYDEDDDTAGMLERGPDIMGGGFKYIGQFQDGMRNGRGKQVSEDYTLYEGYWKEDMY